MLPLLPIWFIYIAAALRLLSGMAYLGATLKGKAKPNPVSWLLWGVIPIIIFIAELQAGVGLIAIVTLAIGLSPLMVFFAAIYKNPRSFKLGGFNLLCVLIATLGIIVWANTETPELAISVLILADIAGALPTLKKVWRKPKSEFPPSFIISSVSVTIALLALQEWSFAAVAYPIYVLLINSALLVLTSRPQPKRKRRYTRRSVAPISL